MKNRKKGRMIFLLILILGVTVGFALLSTTLKINGTAGIKANTWSVHWDDESVEPTAGSNITPTTAAHTTDSKQEVLEFAVSLELPGDNYEFTVDAVNDGTIAGQLDTIVLKLYEEDGTTEITTIPSYLEYYITNADGSPIVENQVIAANGGRQTYKVKIGIKSTETNIPTGRVIKPKIEVPYVQKNKDVDPCNNFATDSWSTINTKVKNNPAAYPIGCEKEVEIGNDIGTHKVRVVNNENCNNESQTACGFVLEFTDIILESRMNNETDTSYTTGGNIGGWQNSVVRGYLNYQIINYFPEDLRNVIRDTTVVSGHNYQEDENFVTIDKLYLLSPKEIYGINAHDTAANATSQLKYYHDLGVDEDHYDAVVKKNGNVNAMWWLRSSNEDSITYFYHVDDDGSIDDNYAHYNRGISPAFRVGK